MPGTKTAREVNEFTSKLRDLNLAQQLSLVRYSEP